MDLVFRAVADATRREMLTRLARGEQTASELGAGFDMSQPAISQHLKVLLEAGLVGRRRMGRRRLYRLRPQALKVVHDWVGAFEDFWDDRIDVLEQVLDDLPDEPEETGDG